MHAGCQRQQIDISSSLEHHACLLMKQGVIKQMIAAVLKPFHPRRLTEVIEG
jgi:hypothetical protein